MKKSDVLWLITSIILVINLLFYFTQQGNTTTLLYVSDILPVICSFVAFTCLIIAYKSFNEFDLAKISWLLVAVGSFLFFIGETTYAILEIHYKVDMNETFPSLADFFWSAGYIPFFAGIATMFYGYKISGFPMGDLKSYAIFGILFIVISFGVIYYLLVPVVNDPETRLFTKFFSLFYPIADLILVAPSVILMYITSLFGKGIVSRPLRFLAIGFICFTVADLLYSILSWQDLYGTGNVIDIAWNFGYLSIGLAAIYQKELIESLK